ncbi:MAG: hypothetical protein AAFQ82_22965, partial [Myxococcota bacterium]
ENRWVPNDSVLSDAERARLAEARLAQGLDQTREVTEGMTDLDADVAGIFAGMNIPNPYNANTTSEIARQLQGLPEFNAAVQSLNALIANGAQFGSVQPGVPTNLESNAALRTGSGDFAGKMQALEAAFPGGNVMEVLYLVFRESIRQTNEDKKYFLVKLQEYNTMAEALSDYLGELVDESQRLSDKASGAKYPEKVNIDITVKTFDTATVNAAGKAVQTSSNTATVDRASLNDEIKNVESMQETVRNKRQMASTAFQNFDQKSNQLYNLMSSVLKVMNEMRSGTTRNML